jgi:alkylation response protein AidB-like acyl-CoA dehydrogenase
MYLELNKDLTPTQVALREQAHRFAAEVLRPASIELDRMDPQDVIAPGSALWDVLKKAYSQGLHLMQFPQELGGANLGPLDMHIVYEETAWGSADFGIAFGVASFPFAYAARFAALTGNQDLMKDIVIPFVEDREGKYIGCWAVTEPEHGSDSLVVGTESFTNPAAAGECRARLDGDEWVINGQKSAWVSNGTIASHALLFMTTDPKMGMAGGGVAVVPLHLPGVTKGKPLNKLGQRALNQGEIFFDDVRIPRHYMLVEGEGYAMTLNMTLASANAGMGALFTGVARAAFEEALAYTKRRRQGGKLICEHQLVQAKLFEMFMRVEQARAVSRAAMIYNSTTFPPSLPHSIASKVTCTQAAFDIASDALQLFGGLGLCKELLIEKLFRDARASLIEDGSNEVLGLVGARQIIDAYPA